MIWPHVNKQNPCPICGKTDWCQFGDKAIKCMRVESEHPSHDGGWYHFLSPGQRPPQRPVSKEPQRQPPKNVNLKAMLDYWNVNTTMAQRHSLASSLEVLVEALIALGAVWAPPHRAWAFPMRANGLEVCGIRLRNMAGQKWAVPGSRQGLFVPAPDLVEPQKVAMICEGPTDTAAALSLGFYAIGRPSCNAGDELVRDCIRGLGIKEAIIVSDNDTAVVAGKEISPGVRGALKLQSSLRIRSCVWAPVTKDLREFLRLGGTKVLVESEIKNLLWKR